MDSTPNEALASERPIFRLVRLCHIPILPAGRSSVACLARKLELIALEEQQCSILGGT
jgi:hypothetical protein